MMPARGSYKLTAAAKAADISPKTLNRNIDRKIIKIPGPDPGKGHPRLFVLPMIYEIAIGHAITKLSVAPTVAMALAHKFVEPQRGREMGKPFATGKTILLATTDGIGSIVKLDADQDLLPLIKESAIVIDIGAIIQNVNSRILSIATSNA
jgi:hypothetical protein